jgi:CHAT domain-containing protein/tetratricopeptide (TPR) repeat protein
VLCALLAPGAAHAGPWLEGTPLEATAQQVDDAMARGDYRRALRNAEAAAARMIRDRGAGDCAVGLALTQANLVREALGDYPAMRPSSERAVGILRRCPAQRTGLARALALSSAVSVFYEDFAAAMVSLDEARRLTGDDAEVDVEVRRRTGEVQLRLGDFEAAEHTCLKAGSKVDESHVEFARAWLCLGEAYVWRDLHRNASKVMQKASIALRRNLGEEHPETARGLVRLASYYGRSGSARKAERMYERALEVLTKGYGPKSRFVAEATAKMADLLHASGQDDRAGPLYAKALETARQALGPEDPDLASRALERAHFAWCAAGDAQAAQQLAEEAVAIRRSALGPRHPSLGSALAEWAERLQASGDLSRARQALSEANDIVDQRIPDLLGRGSDRQKRVNMSLVRGLTEQTLSLHRAAGDDDAARMALRTVLRRKGRVLDALAGDVLQLRMQLTPADRKLLDELADWRSQLASARIGRVRKGIDHTKEALGGMSMGFVEAGFEFSIRRLEGQLSARARELGSSQSTVTIEAVQGALPRGSALVEVVAYQPRNVSARRGKGRHGPSQYQAYVLSAEGTIDAVDLGPAAPIDGLVTQLRGAIVERSEQARRLGRDLDQALMRPIRPLLRGARTLFVSLDGLLHLVPLGALVDENDNYLVESMSFTHLTTGRDLLRFASPQPARGKPLIVANPDFGGAASGSGDTRAMVRLEGMRFPALPGTAEEAEALRGLISDAEVRLGGDATETALRKVQGPRILHVATHGYFLTDQNERLAGSRALVLDEAPEPAQPKATLLELRDPLLRSGLALRGANEIPQTMGKADDGLLTALEASSLDLVGTKLVVLSACETGVGEVRNGDGVYGLRRALATAGAETQVMSLWKVDDEATRDLMIAYYRRLTQNGGRTESLRRAQLDALAKPARAHPYFWAAFLVSGDPRSLDGKPVEPEFTKEMPRYDPPPGQVPPGADACACAILGAGGNPSAALLLFAAGLALAGLRGRGGAGTQRCGHGSRM